MALNKFPVGHAIVLFASLRNCMVMGGHYSTKMIPKDEALRGREEAMNWTKDRNAQHYVNKNRLLPPFPEGMALAMFGMGCFWGAEKQFWQTKGVYSTQVGIVVTMATISGLTYAPLCLWIRYFMVAISAWCSLASSKLKKQENTLEKLNILSAPKYCSGFTKNPTYGEVCGGMTNHNEVVQIVYPPFAVSYQDLLKIFWENHDPTQGMRQGNDSGTQYRSGIYYFNEEQQEQAENSKKLYQQELLSKGFGKITTEIKEATEFYYAEDYHQQYLAKNPGGYCGIGGTGVSCPIGLGPKAEL